VFGLPSRAREFPLRARPGLGLGQIVFFFFRAAAAPATDRFRAQVGHPDGLDWFERLLALACQEWPQTEHFHHSLLSEPAITVDGVSGLFLSTSNSAARFECVVAMQLCGVTTRFVHEGHPGCLAR